jgi:hypothetical protein
VTLKNTLKSSVAVAALFAIAAPVTAEAGNITNGKTAKLSISGQIVKAISRLDDGASDETYITDGDWTSSRLRWVATSKLSDATTVGGTIEMNIPQSQPASSPNLGSPNTDGATGADSAWGIRHQYVYASNKGFGKIYLGQTSTASDGASEASYTGTGIFAGSDGSGYGNSVLFQETTTVSNPQASSVKVSAAITNMDHSGRADVLRYDTPTFMGLKGMMSYRPSEGDVDLQLRYNEKFDDVKVRVRGGYSSYNATATKNYIVSGSMALGHDSGLHMAVAGGVTQLINDGAPNKVNAGHVSSFEAIDTANDGIDDPSFWAVTVGYNTQLMSAGKTAFSINYNETSNNVQKANHDDNQGISLTVAATQAISSIGTTIGVEYAHYEYDAKSGTTDNTYEDVDALTLMTVFKF